MTSAVPPRRPADARLVRIASRLVVSACVALGAVVVFGVLGAKGWTAFAFVLALVLAIGGVLVFALAAVLPPRRM